MTLKCLSTQFNEIVFLSHIQSLRIEDTDNCKSIFEAELVAVMDNGDEITLAEYENYNTCEDVFNCIAVWASMDDDTSVFILWHDDESLHREIQKQKEQYGGYII